MDPERDGNDECRQRRRLPAPDNRQLHRGRHHQFRQHSCRANNLLDQRRADDHSQSDHYRPRSKQPDHRRRPSVAHLRYQRLTDDRADFQFDSVGRPGEFDFAQSGQGRRHFRFAWKPDLARRLLPERHGRGYHRPLGTPNGGVAQGGAVYHSGSGSLTISGSTFTSDSAQGGAGGIGGNGGRSQRWGHL